MYRLLLHIHEGKNWRQRGLEPDQTGYFGWRTEEGGEGSTGVSLPRGGGGGCWSGATKVFIVSFPYYPIVLYNKRHRIECGP
jgi:hypothetical protein